MLTMLPFCLLMQEYLLVGSTPQWELLCMLGAFGACISGTQAALLERGPWARFFSPEAVAASSLQLANSTSLLSFDAHAPASDAANAEVLWSPAAVPLAVAAYVLASLLFYLLLPAVLVLGGGTVLNLSLLTSDLWAAAARLLLYGGRCTIAGKRADGKEHYTADHETHGHMRGAEVPR